MPLSSLCEILLRAAAVDSSFFSSRESDDDRKQMFSHSEFENLSFIFQVKNNLYPTEESVMKIAEVERKEEHFGRRAGRLLI